MDSVDEELSLFLEDLNIRTQLEYEKFESSSTAARFQSQIEAALEQRQETVQSACLSTKHSLDFGSCHIDDFDSITIALYLHEMHYSIRMINLGSNAFTDEGLLTMLPGMQLHSQLQELYLGNNDLSLGTGIQGLSVILPCFKSLRILGLGGNGIEDDQIVQLCSSISGIASLRNIQLHNNKMTDEGLLCLIALLLSNQIETLYIGGNDDISQEGLIRFFECISLNSTLKSLHVNDTPMSMKCIQAVSLCLLSNDALEELNLGNCDIDDDGFMQLVESIKCNQNLQYLHLWSNSLTYESANMIVEILENYNSKIQGITLYNNDIIDRDVLKNIHDLLHQNVYFEDTVRNEQFYENKIQERVKKEAEERQKKKKDVDDYAEAFKRLEGKKIEVATSKVKPAESIPSKVSSSSTATAATATAVKSISSSTQLKRPPVLEQQKVLLTHKNVNISNSTVHLQSKKGLANGNVPAAKGAVDAAKKTIPTGKPLSSNSSRQPLKPPVPTQPKKVEVVKKPSSVNGQVENKKKNNMNDQNKLGDANNNYDDDDDDDDDDLGYVSLSAATEQKKIADTDQEKQTNEKQLNEVEGDDNDWQDEVEEDDQEDEKELEILDKMEKDGGNGKYNGILEFIDDYYDDGQEAESMHAKQAAFTKNVLKYDLKDMNTLKWKGFFEDPKTGLLKSQLE